MDNLEMAPFVDQAVADAAQAFGDAAPAAVLDQYARDVALEFWMTRPGATVSHAGLVGRSVRVALGPRPVWDAALAAD
jgi:hypothetical protein